MGGKTSLASHLGDGTWTEIEKFCDFGSRYERFHERLILTCGRSLYFRERHFTCVSTTIIGPKMNCA
jgi:hypothetical protein